MANKLIHKVEKTQPSMKLSDILREQLGFSSRLIRVLKKEKKVSVNDIVLSYNERLRIGDVIQVNMPDEANIFEPENMPIDVLYEDNHFIVINKQPFVVVHPTKGHPFGTIANGMANYMENRGDSYKIRFANRLDRDTSGAMIICKDGYAQKIISDQMQNNTIVKQYYAIVEGLVLADKATINEPIDRAYEDSVHRIVREDGYPSVTHYEVIERFGENTLLLVTLETGRTHQIRVHLKHIGHNLLGDVLYGGNHDLIGRQALHACKLIFKDIQGDIQEVNAPICEDMQLLIEKMRLR